MSQTPLRVAVVTPYFRTPNEWLAQCHDSVRCQTYPCTHILVADGEPQAIVESFDCQAINLSVGHADYGDTPRAIGSMSAIGQGFDAIAYLDADNWYARGHIALLVALHHETGAAICTSKRMFFHVDGVQQLAMCLASDGETFCDTSCLMLFRPAFRLASAWALMDPEEHPIDDRVVWYRIRESGLKRAHDPRASVAYRATNTGIYKDIGEPIPPGAKVSPSIAQALSAWERKGNPSLKLAWRYGLMRARSPAPTVVPQDVPRSDDREPRDRPA